MRTKIKIIDSLFNPDGDSNVRKKSILFEGITQKVYKVYLYLDGLDLPFVESVTFYLHHSIRRPIIKSTRSIYNQNCIIEFWTPGIFNLSAKIQFSNGDILIKKQKLRFDKQLKQLNEKENY